MTTTCTGCTGYDHSPTGTAPTGGTPPVDHLTARTPGPGPAPGSGRTGGRIADLARRHAVPACGPSVPPRRELPQFPPIRAGGGRYGLRRAVPGRTGTLLAGSLLAAAAAGLLAGPVTAGLPPPFAAPLHRTGCQSDAAGDHP